MNSLLDRRGFAPPIRDRCADRPMRLQRPRKRAPLPPGAVYVGKPTLWTNVFSRPGIGHARSVILYRAWIQGDLSPYVLARAGFTPDEVQGLRRRRFLLLEQLPTLAGRDLQCWCPVTSPWCHADVLIEAANNSAWRLAA